MTLYELYKEFEDITDELLLVDIEEDIQEVIEDIEVGLKKREDLIKKIKENNSSSFSDEKLLQIIEKNNRLETKFAEIKLLISDSIKDVITEKSLSSVKKKAHRGYMNVGRQNDGYFIDNKK